MHSCAQIYWLYSSVFSSDCDTLLCPNHTWESTTQFLSSPSHCSACTHAHLLPSLIAFTAFALFSSEFDYKWVAVEPQIHQITNLFRNKGSLRCTLFFSTSIHTLPRRRQQSDIPLMTKLSLFQTIHLTQNKCPCTYLESSSSQPMRIFIYFSQGS